MKRVLKMCSKAAGKAGLLFFFLAVVVLSVRYWPDFDEQFFALYTRSKGVYGVLLYIAATAVGSALGVPRQGLSFVGGYAFGALKGVLFATLGTTLGCVAGFFVARRMGRRFMPLRFARRMEALDAFVTAAPFSATLTVRCLPVGNNALTNVLAGISSMPALGFIAGSFVGYIPQNFIFSLLGSGMRVDTFWRVLFSAVLFAFAVVVGVVLIRRHKAFFSIKDPDREGPGGERANDLAMRRGEKV